MERSEFRAVAANERSRARGWQPRAARSHRVRAGHVPAAIGTLQRGAAGNTSAQTTTGGLATSASLAAAGHRLVVASKQTAPSDRTKECRGANGTMVPLIL